jgi:presenilin-like A22 family membrane protease
VSIGIFALSSFSFYNHVKLLRLLFMLKLRSSPLLWGATLFALSQLLAFYIAFQERAYLEENEIASPDISLGPVVAYFFGAVLLIGLALFFMPFRVLRIVFRSLFGLMFAWGAFIVLAFTLPLPLTYALAAFTFIVWFFWARVWLHDLLLILALASAASVFGFLLSPWTFMLLLLVVALYDVVAVRSGYMLWIADKLSEFSALPAFVLPRRLADWNLSMKKTLVSDLTRKQPGEREYSILGGGDIGFPLMLVASVFFDTGLVDAIIVSAFALSGLLSAFVIQQLLLKGKPMPALPPIAFAGLIGFLIVTFAL